MTDAKPYPKAAQLARGERRYRRKVAGPKQWQAIIAAKVGPCRLAPCCAGTIEFHHVIPRDLGGDDAADNIVPLCSWHHDCITKREWFYVRCLRISLTSDERAYVVGKLGEGGMERLFRVSTPPLCKADPASVCTCDQYDQPGRCPRRP